MRPKPAHAVQQDFDFLIIIFKILFIYLFLACNFEVLSFILVLDSKRDCSPHKSTLSCLCYMFSVPCLLCHFLSPMVVVVSLYLILFSLLASCIYIYIYIYTTPNQKKLGQYGKRK